MNLDEEPRRQQVAPERINQLHGNIREAEADDVGPICDYLARFSDTNLLPRPEADYRDAARLGTLFVTEIGAEIIAVAGAFLLVPDDRSVVEIGSMHTAPMFRGFGIQQAMTCARVASIVANLSGSPNIYAAVKPRNT